MIVLHSIDEMFQFYITFGGERMEVKNGFCYNFPDTDSHVRFWGNLHGFSAAAADFTFPKEMIIRNHFSQRYIGIGFIEEGSSKGCTYTQKDQARHIMKNGINCFVLDSPHSFFMKLPAEEKMRFKAFYFQEKFFEDNGIRLYDSFWRDAKNALCNGEIHAPELVSIYRQIEKSPLTGDIFDTWLHGQGLAAAALVMDLVRRHAALPPTYLDVGERNAVELAKQLLKTQLKNSPTIPDLCKLVGMNKNKLQKGFQLTEGKSISEYIRAVRMEQALELLENSELSVREISEHLGYLGISNFYHVFKQTFGDTPVNIRNMLKGK